MLRFHNFASITALTLLFNALLTHATDGVLDGSNSKDAAGRQFLDSNPEYRGLTDIKWSGNAKQGIATALQNKKPVFLKCGPKLQKEVMAYDMLVTAKNQLKAKKEIGQDSTLNPLDRFVINERRKSKTVTLDCVVYNLVDGVELGKMVANTLYDEINYFVELLPDILEGAIYLHEAGIEHNDIAAKNIMVYKDLANGRMRAVVIDYDSSIPLNPVATINPKTGKPTKPPTTKRLYFPCKNDNEFIANIITDYVGSSPFSDLNKSYEEWYKTLERSIKSKLLWLKQANITPDHMARLVKVIVPLFHVVKTLTESTSNCMSTIQALSQLRSFLALSFNQ